MEAPISFDGSILLMPLPRVWQDALLVQEQALAEACFHAQPVGSAGCSVKTVGVVAGSTQACPARGRRRPQQVSPVMTCACEPVSPPAGRLQAIAQAMQAQAHGPLNTCGPCLEYLELGRSLAQGLEEESREASLLSERFRAWLPIDPLRCTAMCLLFCLAVPGSETCSGVAQPPMEARRRARLSQAKGCPEHGAHSMMIRSRSASCHGQGCRSKSIVPSSCSSLMRNRSQQKQLSVKKAVGCDAKGNRAADARQVPEGQCFEHMPDDSQSP